MIIKELKLQNFRNYSSAVFRPNKGISMLYGANAQGKTNLLEAIYLFTAAKSFRTPRDAEMIQFDKEAAIIKGEFEAFGRSVTAEIRLFTGKRKLLLYGGAPLLKTSELLGKFPAVVFSPDELRLIGDAPEARRRFMDSAISAKKPMYYNALYQYIRARKQKNALLKKEAQPESLSVWNEQMATEGALLIQYRQNFFTALSPVATEIHRSIAPEETLEIRYVPAVQPGEDTEKTKEKLFELLERKREAELYAGLSLVGPHRDDMQFYINGKPAREYASQGQQRTATIALKAAQAALLEKEVNEPPLLLLDDVMGELDPNRRAFLAETMAGRQTIVTGTEKEIIPGLSQYFQIEKGAICTFN
ncbi:MAG: DNA replication/repair protein RecF [Clostridia bacterium]|nr:DNA replication/repair protein RecF [Clostridia bacterium]